MYEDKSYTFLMHYGTPRHSGRYPWGSGDNPYQHNMDWYAQYKEYKAQGYSDNECAALFGMNTREFREQRSISKEQELNEKRIRALRLKDHGYKNAEIARLMGTNESNVRNWLAPVETKQNEKINGIADTLRKTVDEKGYIDVGKGVEIDMGISRERMKTALSVLKDKGYVVEDIQVEQATNPGKYTTVQVLAPPGTSKKDIWKNIDKIGTFTEYSPDGGETWTSAEFPTEIDPDRVYIRYAEDGGTLKDGVIELRRNVPDLSMGANSYAQVRIGVAGDKYMKGMAIYTDDIPEGYDIVWNSNKTKDTPKSKVFKSMKVDEETGIVDQENPFGAVIKANGQYYYEDEKGNKKLGAINIIKEEGDVDKQSKTLAAQFLSKQPRELIKRQLDLAYSEKLDEYDEISKLTNPAVKQKLLSDFAESCDSDAVHLKAAKLPGQTTKFILPCDSLKDTEVYAPGYKNGQKVCLIRYPHAGIFEIPELTVNNNNPDAKKLLGQAVDAIGINVNVASKLSGADFDGDTVMVIPTSDKVKIKTAPSLEGLKNFNPSERYPGYDGMKVMDDKLKQAQMGIVTNLINDMTIKGATDEEMTRAVRHSMVVIDAVKHELDWKASEKDNGIAELHEKYQGKKAGGASTLISKAKGEARIDKVRRDWKPDEETGAWIYKETGETYTKAKRYSKDVVDKKTGKVLHKKGDKMVDSEGNYIYETKKSQTKMPNMLRVSDARELSSGHPTEELYADWANKLKALANESRKEAMAIKPVPVNSSAKSLYSEEVSSLQAKLNIAKKNSPRERMAQIQTQAKVREQRGKKDKEHLKKYAQQQLAINRVKYGATGKKTKIVISDKEWEAIQNNAISTNQLKEILAKSDMDQVRQLATPRKTLEVSAAKQNRMKNLAAAGYTLADIADQTGYSASTVSKYIK